MKSVARPILLAALSGNSRKTLCPMLEGWETSEAITLAEAVEILGRCSFGLVICDGDTTNGDWRRLLAYLEEQPEAPLVIVSSRLADERLWAEVLNLGGYDVLVQPFDEGEVRRVVGRALMASVNGLTQAMGSAGK